MEVAVIGRVGRAGGESASVFNAIRPHVAMDANGHSMSILGRDMAESGASADEVSHENRGVFNGVKDVS